MKITWLDSFNTPWQNQSGGTSRLQLETWSLHFAANLSKSEIVFAIYLLAENRFARPTTTKGTCFLG